MEAAGVSEEPEARSVRPVGSPWSPDLGDFFFQAMEGGSALR